jgi:tRNA A37 N6-isopentenylltransferase MiaA
MVRHGCMVVGTTGTGKTVLSATLGKALGQLRAEGSKEYMH